ncbi:MAG: DUF2087 domain-containing protein [Betaproteobacteria bacterium]|jgi:hypothetical protein
MPQTSGATALPASLVKLPGMVVKTGVSLGQMLDADRRLALALPAWRLPVGQSLAEDEVNELLKDSLGAESAFLRTDHVELRRWLVDTGWWSRDGYGRAYTRPAAHALPEDLRPIAQALSMVDPAAWALQQVAIYLAAQRERRARWSGAADSPQQPREVKGPAADQRTCAPPPTGQLE